MSASQGFRPSSRWIWRPVFALALAAILLATWWCYRPGLSGDFLFDDFANLPALGATGPVDHWATFWRYITSGTADPTGRPLTLLTFLIDARDWPAPPYPFKLTNLLLHLLNGALLCAVLLRLGRALCPSPLPVGEGGAQRCSAVPSPPGRRWREAPDEGSVSHQPAASNKSAPSPLPLSRRERGYMLAALFGAGAWLLHPLFVSTTLYVVQREAMLPATFVLLGMLGWMAARAALASGKTARGLTGMVLAAGGCTVLAALSKGNGALLPLLLLLIEWIVLAPHQPMPAGAPQRAHRIAVAALLILPALILLGWLLAQIPSSLRFAEFHRGWSVPQRLLSEPRALIEYFALLWLPRAYSRGVLTDGFHASTDLFHPWATLPCALGVLALIVAAFALRKKYPALALAILFYFAGQLIESTWLPLELYYEHRNYLPALLMFWPLGIALCKPGGHFRLRACAAIAILALLGAMTFFRATLWGDSYTQALVWAQHNPDSARAQANAAQFDLAHGHPELAAARLRGILPLHPGDIQIPVNLIDAECALGGIRPETLQRFVAALARAKAGAELTFQWFGRALDSAAHGSCRGLDATTLQTALDSARSNPHWRESTGLRVDMAHMQGMLYLSEGDPSKALAAFDRALATRPTPDAALQQAAILGSRGFPALGLAHLDYFATLSPAPKPAFGMPRIHAWVLARQHYWGDELIRLRATLQADAAKARAHPVSNG